MRRINKHWSYCPLFLLWLWVVANLALSSCSRNSARISSDIPADILNSSRYQVYINGSPMPVYKTALNINVAHIALQSNETAQIVVKCKDAGYWSEGATIRPLSKGIVPVISGDSLVFQLTAPAMLTVERNNQIWNHTLELDRKRNDPSWWQEGFRYSHTLQFISNVTATTEVLFLFADTLQNAPQQADNLIRLLPGIHTGNIDLHSGQHLHLDKGAFLLGSVNIWDAENVRISGQGTIIHDGDQPPYVDRGFQTERNWRPISINNSHNISISGITCIARSRTWAIQATACDSLQFDGIKIIAANLANLNGDGIDLCGTQNVVIKNCFFRTCDDAIALYRTLPFDSGPHHTWNGTDYSHNVRTLVKNVGISDCIFWNTSANVMRVGWTGMQLETDSITMRNCDVIHLSDCSYYHVPHSLLAIMSEDGSGIASHSNYLFEDIRLEEYSALVGIKHQNARLKNFLFKDIQTEEPGKWPSLIIAPKADERNGIAFENITIGKQPTKCPEDVPLYVEKDCNVVFR